MGLGHFNYSAFRAPLANPQVENAQIVSKSSDDSSSSEAISDSSESSVELMDVEEFKDDRPMP